MEKKYYTPEEVAELLKISKTTLNRRASSGEIPSELEEGRKRGRKYPREAIDVHIKRMKPKSEKKLTFGPATNAELWASYQNHFNMYEPEDIVAYDKLLDWKDTNNNIFMSAKENGKRIGGVTIIPLTEDAIKALIDDKIREQEIDLWDIRKWTEENLDAYICSISIHHTGNEKADRERGMFIIKCAIRWAISLSKRYNVRKWYAIPVTKEGRKLVQHLGFKKIEGKRETYMVEDMDDAVKPIKLFIDRIDQIEELLLPTSKKKM